MLASFFSDFSDSLGEVYDFFERGKYFMAALLICAIVSLTVIIYRILSLRRNLVIPPDQEEELQRINAYVESGDLGPLAAQLDHDVSPLGRIARSALGPHADVTSAREGVQARAKAEIIKLESGIPVLEVIITIAPLLGLLGTVSGLVDVFSVIGTEGTQSLNSQAIADGIAKALNTTIAGLVVAVPSVIAHSYFVKKIETMAVHMEGLMEQVVSAIYSPVSTR